jgi:tight adherence protein B
VVAVTALADPGRTAIASLSGAGFGLGVFLLVRVVWRDRTRTARPGAQRGRVAPRDRQRLILRCAATIAVGAAVGIVTGWVVGALLGALGCWFLPRILGRDAGHQRRIARIEGVATWTEMIRDTLSAAAGLEQAVLATAPLAPPAVREEIAMLAARLGRGERLAPALRLLARDLDDATADLVVAALVMAAEQQARQLADLLGALATTAREQASMRMRVEAGRARTRTSVRVIVGTTCTFAALVVMFNRTYLTIYDTLTGQLVLLGIGVLFATGFAWLARIAWIPEPDRLLAVEDDLRAESGERV